MGHKGCQPHVGSCRTVAHREKRVPIVASLICAIVIRQVEAVTPSNGTGVGTILNLTATLLGMKGFGSLEDSEPKRAAGSHVMPTTTSLASPESSHIT